MIVSNTTPLINFAATGRLDILQALFGNIVIPPQVAVELQAKHTLFPGVVDVLTVPFMSMKSFENRPLYTHLLEELDEGEAAAIVLAQENSAELLLLDEMHGRKVANTLSLPVTGSIGCLVEAKRTGIIDNIKPLLDDMIQDARFWIHRGLYERVLNETGETVAG